MQAKAVLSVVGVLLHCGVALAQAPLGTAFTYQGQLKQSDAPADGLFNFAFRLFDAASGGVQIGGTQNINGVNVVDGLFTVSLDFGAAAFGGERRWLDIAVNGTLLLPRQELTATPYALFALNAPSTGGYWAANGTSIYNTNAGNVGVGTNAPSGPLHLRAAQSFARLETTGSGNGSVLELWNAGGDQTTIGAINFRNTAGYPGQIAYLGGGAQAMTFRVSDVERARIDAAGRFGLGTISPAAQLHVKSFLAAGTSLAQFTSVVNAPPFNSETLHFTFNDISADGILSGAPVDLPISLNDLSTGNVVLAGGGGKVGVRTGSPTHFLTVESPDSETMRLIGPGATYGYFGRLNFGDADYVYLYEDQDDRLEIHSSRTAFTGGSIGINTFAPARRLDVYDTGIWSARFGTNNSNAAACEFANFQSGTIWEFAVCGTQSFFGLPAGSMYLFRQSSPSPDLTILPDGTTRVKVLEITGADLAEKFPTSEAREAVEPGTVMEIDPENAGKLRIARGAYNRRVAGVVSGAGDLSVGAVLGNLPGCEDAPPIALSGRVWVRCDASEQGIEPGDLLTTSDTPGYAMKVIDCPRAQGAIIGKAMSTLGHGETGLVLVLVGLQ